MGAEPHSLRLQVQPSPHGGVFRWPPMHLGARSRWPCSSSGSLQCSVPCGALPSRTARDQVPTPGSRLLAYAVGTLTSRSGSQPLRTWELFHPPMAVAFGVLSARSLFPEKPQVWGAPTQGLGLPPRIPAKPGWPVARACCTPVASGNVLSLGSTSRPLPPRVGPGSTVTGLCVPAYLLFGRDCVSWCSCHPTREGQPPPGLEEEPLLTCYQAWSRGRDPCAALALSSDLGQTRGRAGWAMAGPVAARDSGVTSSPVGASCSVSRP